MINNNFYLKQIQDQSKEIGSSQLSLFNQFCKIEFGLDFEGNNQSILIKAIISRIHANALVLAKDYYFKLKADRKEQQEFVCLLTINETYFYREEAHLDFLLDSLVPKLQHELQDKLQHKLQQDQRTKPIQILCIGCSNGAEPYSIAIALHQRFGSQASKMFTIIGADIDNKALEIAKSGTYSPMAFRTLSAKLKQTYFVEQVADSSVKTTQPLHSNFVLKPEIQKMVSWQYMNIVSDIVDPNLAHIDILFFRNISIYFDQKTLQAIHKRFTKILNPNAYLLVGLTESMSNNLGILSLNNEGEIFYFQNKLQAPSEELSQFALDSIQSNKKIKLKVGSKVKAQIERVSTKPSIIRPVISNQKVTKLKVTINKSPHVSHDGLALDKVTLDGITKLIQQKKYNKALIILENILSPKESTKIFSFNDKGEKYHYLLLRSFIFFNRQEFILAEKDSLDALTLNPFSVDIFLLLAMIAKWQEQIDDAINWFKKALYVSGDCWIAHYYLAGLYHETGHETKARQEYLLVLQQLDKPYDDDCQSLIIPLSLPEKDVRLVSQCYLNQAIQNKEKRYGT